MPGTTALSSQAQTIAQQQAQAPAHRRSVRRRTSLAVLAIALGLAGASFAGVAALGCAASSALTAGPRTDSTPVAQADLRELRKRMETWDAAWRTKQPPRRADAFAQVYVAPAMRTLAANESFEPRRHSVMKVEDVRISGDTAWTTVQLQHRQGAPRPNERVQQVWRKAGDGWRVELERFEPLAPPASSITPY